MGGIVAVYPGKHDGIVRVVDVETRIGIYRKLIMKLCKLNVEPDCEVNTQLH